jgi:lipopolysaccharide/colanic/teichoic acid biosynthesis glycosyltransferase
MIEERLLATGGGYLRPARALSIVFNYSLALILFVLSLPLLLLIALLILVKDGRPIMYRGVRLGLNKNPFVMYKFRTLVPDADRIIGPNLLGDKHELITPLGKFLRDTRLDELPQLFNILKGDMEFVGPRPVRPVIYDHMCRKIRNYDKRFTIKPGLIGFSQLFTPHTTPKTMRALIDNTLIDKKEKFFWDILIVFFTIAVISKTIACRLYRNITEGIILCKLCARYQEKREFERVRLKSGRVYYSVGPGDKDFSGEAKLIDINAEAFLMNSATKIEQPFPSLFKLRIPSPRARQRSGLRSKQALCEGDLYRESACQGGGYSYVIMYTAVSPLNYYLVRQYFLQESVAR